MPTDKPNIVLFVAEDLDYEGLNCYEAAQTGYTGVIKAGNPNFPDAYTVDRMLTPTIDSLAESGFMSTNYYCVSAICTPARYAILTGRYPERNPHFCRMYPPNTQANIFFNIGMERDETNLPKTLQAHGYTTGMVGKWHNFPQEVKLRLVDMHRHIPMDADPRDLGIRQAIQAWYQMAVDYLKEGFGWDFVDRVYFDNPEPFHPRPINGHNLEWIIEGALNFLEENRAAQKPFFLYIPVTTPHSRYKPDIFSSDPLGTAAGMLEEAPDVFKSRQEIIAAVRDAGLPDYAREGFWLDEGVRAVLEKLDEIGATENTCFIFTTDHPTAGKETCHMGRIPLIIRWPGRVEPGFESDTLIAETDLAPTILDIAGCDILDDMKKDGSSFKALLICESAYPFRENVLMEVVNSRGIVAGKWKYIANRLPDELKATVDLPRAGWFGSNYYDNVRFRDALHHQVDKLFPHYFDEDQLYDLETDLCEQNNLAADPAYALTLAEMKELLRAELEKLPHPFGEFVTRG
jgi:arylsulfatase A-like enzyme